MLVPCSELCCELELLLLLGAIEVVFTAVLLGARQVRSLSRIILMIRGLESSLGEVGAHLLGSFTFLESDSEAALAGTDTLKVVLLDLGRDDVSSIGSFFESLLVAVGRQTSDIDVNNLTSLGIVGRPVVFGERVLIIDVR